MRNFLRTKTGILYLQIFLFWHVFVLLFSQNGVISDCDLKEIGIMKEADRQTILKECAMLPHIVGNYWMSPVPIKDTDHVKNLVKEWLDSINLGVYAETFRKNLYNDLDRIKRIWEVELTAFLEITKPGHRHRILASVNDCKPQCLSQAPNNHDLSGPNNLDDLHADLDQLVSVTPVIYIVIMLSLVDFLFFHSKSTQHRFSILFYRHYLLFNYWQYSLLMIMICW